MEAFCAVTIIQSGCNGNWIDIICMYRWLENKAGLFAIVEIILYVIFRFSRDAS